MFFKYKKKVLDRKYTLQYIDLSYVTLVDLFRIHKKKSLCPIHLSFGIFIPRIIKHTVNSKASLRLSIIM